MSKRTENSTSGTLLKILNLRSILSMGKKNNRSKIKEEISSQLPFMVEYRMEDGQL